MISAHVQYEINFREESSFNANMPSLLLVPLVNGRTFFSDDSLFMWIRITEHQVPTRFEWYLPGKVYRTTFLSTIKNSWQSIESQLLHICKSWPNRCLPRVSWLVFWYWVIYWRDLNNIKKNSKVKKFCQCLPARTPYNSTC